MSDETDTAAQEFAKEIAPATRPRDQSGKFVETRSRPEPMFQARPIEGDEVTGDTRDGGDNPALRAHENEVLGRREPDDRNVEDTEFGDLSPEEREAVGRPSEESAEATPDTGQKFEVTIDGKPHQVTLEEALEGYIRQETFHQRLAEINEARGAIEEEAGRQQQNWGLLNQARADYEEDLKGLIPPEPNWDQAFAVNPQEAHNQQKIYQTIYAKLAESRAKREQAAAYNRQEADRRLQKYAVDGFARFVADAKIPDKPTLEKELNSMRKTAFAEGFGEQEVATVYDPRMLRILQKASKYDRMMAAAKPKAVAPGQGRTLTPGASTPLSGNGRRSGLDDAQRKLARSGRLDDAEDVFRRII